MPVVVKECLYWPQQEQKEEEEADIAAVRSVSVGSLYAVHGYNTNETSRSIITLSLQLSVCACMCPESITGSHLTPV